MCAVSYLNTVPLVWGLLHGRQRGRFDLSFCLPSECADRLASGQADIGIVPTAELARLDLEIIPGTPEKVRLFWQAYFWILDSTLLALPLPLRAAPDLGPVRLLAVQDGGRVKPFDTFARETSRRVTGARAFGAESVQGREPVEGGEDGGRGAAAGAGAFEGEGSTVGNVLAEVQRTDATEFFIYDAPAISALGHLLLRQPDSFLLQTNFDPRLSVFGLVDQDFRACRRDRPVTAAMRWAATRPCAP